MSTYVLAADEGNVITLTSPYALPGSNYPGRLRMGSEAVYVTGGAGTIRISVQRGMDDTTQATGTPYVTTLTDDPLDAAAPTLAEVLVAGNDPDGTTIRADAALDSGATLSLEPRSGGGDVLLYAGGELPASDVLGGAIQLRAGDIDGGGRAQMSGGAGDVTRDGGWVGLISGGSVGLAGELFLSPGLADGTNGRLEVNTDNSTGTSGQALISDGASGVVWGGIASGAGVPIASDFDGFLPLYRRTTNNDLYILVGVTVVGPYNLGV